MNNADIVTKLSQEVQKLVEQAKATGYQINDIEVRYISLLDNDGHLTVKVRVKKCKGED